MGGLGHDVPTVAQHACNMLVHGLHAWEQPLPVVLPGPIPLVSKRLHFHLGRCLAPLHSWLPSLQENLCTGLYTGSEIILIVDEQIANLKQMLLRSRGIPAPAKSLTPDNLKGR